MLVNLKLVIAHLDLHQVQCLFLLDEQELLSTKLSDPNIKDNLYKLANEYLEANTEIFDYKLVDIYSDVDRINIVYFVLVPDVLKNIKGKWYSVGEIKDENIQTILFMASQHIRF